MSDSDRSDDPPQPILIQASVHVDPAASGPLEEPPSAPSTIVVAPSEQTAQIEKALAKVQFLLNNEPNVGGLVVLSGVLAFGVPFLLLFASIESNSFTDGGINLCWSSFFAGIVLALVASYQHEAWKKALQQAKAEAVEAANMSLPEHGDYRKVTLVCVAMFTIGLAFGNVVLLWVGLLSPFPWLLSRAGSNNDINRAFARVKDENKKEEDEEYNPMSDDP